MESTTHNAKKEKDEAISKVLKAVIARPLFLGLLHNALENPRNILHYSLAFGKPRANQEVVGSSRDGLKCFKVFSSGDVDCLVYSDVVLDKSAEQSFEYRHDFPAYLHFPQPESFGNLPKVEGRYVNANHIRQMHKSLFASDYELRKNLYPFSILPETLHVSDVKCAITRTTNYKDTTYSSECAPSPGLLSHKFYIAWTVDQTVLAYHMNCKNHERLQFLRELLYGSNANLETIETLKTSMKHLVSYWKYDFTMTLFGVYDLLFFDNQSFQELLKPAVDVETFDRYRCRPTQLPHGEYSCDMVPAIRCKTWPRPAQDFITRERKWPAKEVIDDIVASGFQLVARGCTIKPEPAKDFILSFSPSEAKLIDNLPHEAKTAYCLLKSFYKCALTKEGTGDKKTLKSYHLKTALLWVAEKTEPAYWKTVVPLAAVRLVIDFLTDCLCKGNLPVFFVPSSNLIGDFNDDDKNSAMDILETIHRNPATFIQLLLDMEWEYTKITMVDDGSFEMLKRDGGPFYELDWETQIKLFAVSSVRAGDCPVDELMENPNDMMQIVDRFTKDALNTDPPLNIADGFRISEEQLEGMDIFVQTVSQNDMDLFTVLNIDVEPDIFHFEENRFKDEFLENYFMFNKDDHRKFGEIFINSSRLRLKFYANVFHLICNKLYVACFTGTDTFINKDVVYIVRFLKLLIKRKQFDQDNLIDCLHYLLFFCHFTRVRHHNLCMTDQILRSMREFFQDARNLMTVYFNPRLIHPQPQKLNDETIGILRECYLGKCGSTPEHHGAKSRVVVEDLPLD